VPQRTALFAGSFVGATSRWPTVRTLVPKTFRNPRRTIYNYHPIESRAFQALPGFCLRLLATSGVAIRDPRFGNAIREREAASGQVAESVERTLLGRWGSRPLYQSRTSLPYPQANSP